MTFFMTFEVQCSFETLVNSVDLHTEYEIVQSFYSLKSKYDITNSLLSNRKMQFFFGSLCNPQNFYVYVDYL